MQVINFFVCQIENVESFFFFPCFAKCWITETQHGRTFLAPTQLVLGSFQSTVIDEPHGKRHKNTSFQNVGFQGHVLNQCMSQINHHICDPCKTCYVCTPKSKSCIWSCQLFFIDKHFLLICSHSMCSHLVVIIPCEISCVCNKSLASSWFTLQDH